MTNPMHALRIALVPGLLAAAGLSLLGIRAPVAASEPAAQTKPKDKKETPIQEELLDSERTLARQFGATSLDLLKLEQRWKRSDRQDDRDRAVVIGKALAKAHADAVSVRFEQIIDGLRGPRLQNLGAIKTNAERAQKLAKGLAELVAVFPDGWRSAAATKNMEKRLQVASDDCYRAELALRGMPQSLKEQVDKLSRADADLDVVALHWTEFRRNLADFRKKLDAMAKEFATLNHKTDDKKKPQPKPDELQSRVLTQFERLLDAKGPLAQAETSVRDFHDALSRDLEDQKANGNRKSYRKAAAACHDDAEKLWQAFSVAQRGLEDFIDQCQAVESLMQIAQRQRECAERLNQWHALEVRRLLDDLLEKDPKK